MSLLDFMLEISEADESFGEEDAVQELCTFMLAVRTPSPPSGVLLLQPR
jgi:hypothetical protein